jgi:uncharacterized protein
MRAFLAFPLVRLVAILVVFASLLALTLPALHAFHARSALVSWIVAALALAVMIAVERLAVGRPPRAIGLDPRNLVRDVIAGLILGTVLFSSVVLVLATAGSYRVGAMHASADLALAALILVPSAAVEEVLFRGVLFRLVEEWAGTWIGLAVSAIAFGLIHRANPGATWLSSLAIAVEAGVLLAAAFVVTGNLWFPIGVHFAWNFCEGPIWGTQISGHEFLTSVVTPHVTGPQWLTGGSFGPEAGVPAIIVGSIAAIALLVNARRRDLFKPQKWKRASRAVPA